MIKEKESVIICRCLVNLPCRYDGKPSPTRLSPDYLAELGEQYHLVPVCPEQLGGLPTPRMPAEIQDGDGFSVLEGKSLVKNKYGEDVTDNFIRGAQCTLKIAQNNGAKTFITQDKSPSCSADTIYTGNFKRQRKKGYGVTAALLKNNGIETIDAETFEEKRQKLR